MRVVGGKYALNSLLATGGMGEVWRARHVELDVPVAVKLLSTSGRDAAATLARFRREARAAASLKSAHVVHVFDFGVDEGAPYLAMELLEGETLREHLERTPRLAMALAVMVVAHTGSALALAHSRGIVHRDVKPSNLFLVRTGDTPVIKVLDFGIAKFRAPGSDDDTLSGWVVGTPGFMSPEQANGDEVDPRSDLWSLGAVTYRMLTGELPFPAATVAQFRAAVRRELQPASARCPSLPVELDDFFRTALAEDPARRHQSAAEFVRDFERAARIPEAGTSGASLRGVASDIAREHATVTASTEARPRFGLATRAALLAALAGGVAALSLRPPEPVRQQVPPTAAPARAASEIQTSAATSVGATRTEVPAPPSARPAPPPPGRAPPRRTTRTNATEAAPRSPPAEIQNATTDPLFGLPTTSSQRHGDPGVSHAGERGPRPSTGGPRLAGSSD